MRALASLPMPRLRILGSIAIVAAFAVGAVGCSDDEPEATESDRGTIEFADAPEGSTDLGLCAAYDLDQMKEIVGGEETFKRLPPAAIGTEGDPVTGEACAWERVEPNGDTAAVRVEVRNYGEDAAGLAEQFTSLQDATIAATPVEGLGDAAFSSESEDTSLLQVQSGPYLLTLSSRSSGELGPVELNALQLMAAAGLEQLP